MTKVKQSFIAHFLLVVLVSCTSDGKKEETEQSEFSMTHEQMLNDFDMFRAIYEQANAGLYKYRPKEAVDSAFAVNKKLIKEGLSYREFYTAIWNVIDYTGSCHNSLSYPDSLRDCLGKQKVFFPIPLKYIDGKLYSNIEYETIPVGSEIVSINDMPEKQFSYQVSRYISTDGFNETGKYAFIDSGSLPYCVYYVLGNQNEFVVSYKTRGSKAIEQKTIKGVTYDESKANYKNKYSKVLENRYSDDYSYTLIDSINVGYLKIKTFGLGGPGSEGHKQYASFLDSVFTALDEQNVGKLIVDIRDNGGGHDPNDILLYSYLTRQEFRENTFAFTIFQDIPYPELYADDDIDELPDDLKEEHSILKDGKFYQNESFNKPWMPKPKAFKGKLVLLIDPYVASAASLFASLVKSDDESIVIGEETLGGYYGHTGHIPVTYELPNSKLLLTFSIVDLEQDVKPLDDERFGDGVVPDIRVVQSYEDFMVGRDTQLQFAVERIGAI